MRFTDTEVLVIGAGPAGTFAAIRLASLGWQVTLVEQSRYPRQKVCGECLGPASLELLDEIGLGADVRRLAGPSIRQVGWAAADRTIVAEMPACVGSRYPHGCAIGRDTLDSLLLERARSQGVDILQPARVRRVSGVPGNLACVCERRDDPLTHQQAHRGKVVRAALVIDAHGSWERSVDGAITAQGAHQEGAPRASDLLAFKATFAGAALAPGVLPVLCLPGGYGGMVVSDRGRTTVAGCIRRETLRQWRARARGESAGEVVETYLRSSCGLAATALHSARREGAWQAVGPLRTGYHPQSPWGILRIGNAAAEAHPLIGEGICMALQSAAILAGLCANRCRELDAASIVDLQRTHAALGRREFSGRLRLARLYARIAMGPAPAAAAAVLMKSWPRVLTTGAQLAGKARNGRPQFPARQALA